MVLIALIKTADFSIIYNSIDHYEITVIDNTYNFVQPCLACLSKLLIRHKHVLKCSVRKFNFQTIEPNWQGYTSVG